MAPVLTLITQFDGGKTHTPTALYHLTRDGSAAGQYPGMSGLLQEARSRLFQASGGPVLILFDTVAMTGTTQGAAVISLPRNQVEMPPHGVQSAVAVALCISREGPHGLRRSRHLLPTLLFVAPF